MDDEYILIPDDFLIYRDTTGMAELAFIRERNNLYIDYVYMPKGYTKEILERRVKSDYAIPKEAILCSGVVHGDLPNILRDYIAYVLDRNAIRTKGMPWCDKHDSHFIHTGDHYLHMESKRENNMQVLYLTYEDKSEEDNYVKDTFRLASAQVLLQLDSLLYDVVNCEIVDDIL